jgi:rfaE bifunctional protein nucleotidyltransferase chain/domain
MIYDACEKVKKTHFRLSGVVFDCIEHKKIIYSYGAWDLLHPGHIKMLQKAKSLGDTLIVGVVRDGAIKKLKGEDRPIQNESDRLKIISTLKCVDIAVLQDDYNPVPNLEKFNPDILVKGDDWDYIPGEEWVKERGKQLVKPPYSKDWSTSAIIKKIREGE